MNIKVEKWLNTQHNFSISEFKGKVVVIYAFQMLCPGCVSHAIPQAKKVNALFAGKELAVIGLHSVFEHHEAMKEVSLRAFIHENKIPFPVAIDMPAENPDNPIPQSMQFYAMKGTPSVLIFDQKGQLRKHRFGHQDDMIIAAEIMPFLIK